MRLYTTHNLKEYWNEMQCPRLLSFPPSPVEEEGELISSVLNKRPKQKPNLRYAIR